MEKYGWFVNKPPLLDETNYDYWKSRMSAYLKCIDNKTWKVVLKGWEHPVVVDKDGHKTEVLKPEEEWSAPEDELALPNSRALNVIFNGVSKNMFRTIKKCNVAKDAWETLKIAHEGTIKIKISKIQFLTTKFERLKMKKDETIRDYYMNVLDIANSFESLGETLSNEKLIRNILRSLPKRYDMKVTTIEEAQDTASMKVEELIESLQNFQIMINSRKEEYMNIAPSADMEESQGNPNNNDNLAGSVVLLGSLFNRNMKQENWKSKSDDHNLGFNIKKKQNDQRIFSTDDKGNQFKEV